MTLRHPVVLFQMCTILFFGNDTPPSSTINRECTIVLEMTLFYPVVLIQNVLFFLEMTLLHPIVLFQNVLFFGNDTPPSCSIIPECTIFMK